MPDELGRCLSLFQNSLQEQVPGNAWIAQAVDPQGAVFALLGKRA
jgi:hypothetical protein